MAFLVWHHWYDPFPSSSNCRLPRRRRRRRRRRPPSLLPRVDPPSEFVWAELPRARRGQEGERARASTLGGQEHMTLAKCSDISSSIQLISSLICSWGNSSPPLTMDVIYTCPPWKARGGGGERKEASTLRGGGGGGGRDEERRNHKRSTDGRGRTDGGTVSE